MKYFETVYKKQNQIIEIDAPVVLQETAIIKDTVDNLVQLRNIFFNVSPQKIIAIAIRISQNDVFGESISAPFEYIYEDINFNPHESFGNKTAIVLHLKARKVKIDILKAVLEDGTVWVSNPENIVEMQSQREIEASDDFIEGIDTNGIKPIFYYAENDSCWQCTCGEPNKLSFPVCRKCHRNREEVKERFNSELIHNQFLKYRENLEQERIKHAEEEKKNVSIVEKKASEIAGSPDKNTKSSKKISIIAAVAVVALIAILSMVMSNNHNNSNADLIEKTKDSIKPYVEMVGVNAPVGNEPKTTQEFIDNLDNVFVMGRVGSVKHEYADGLGDTIAMMHWESNEAATKEEYDDFVQLINDYCKSEPEKGKFDSDVAVDSLKWNDPYYDLDIVAWYEGKLINIRWQLKDDDFNGANTPSGTSSEDLIAKTKESLNPYINMIGVDTTENSLSVSQEFLDGLDKVFVMGKYGTVSHASTDGSGDTITTMDWISNETFTREELEGFVDLLNDLFEGKARIAHYSNITDGDVWAWEIMKDNLWPICFLNNERINVRWYDRSAVNIPGESKNEQSSEAIEETDLDRAKNISEELPHIILESGSIYTAPKPMPIYEEASTDSSVVQTVEKGWSVAIDDVIDNKTGCYYVSLFRGGKYYSGYMFIGEDDIPTYSPSESKSIQEQPTPANNTNNNKTVVKHVCEQCGKPASHSIMGLNGTTEWYCNDHWEQMHEMLEYMINN